MTSPNHESGTERLAEVIEVMNIPDDHIIVKTNRVMSLLYLPPAIINQVANVANSTAPMATLGVEITHADEVFNPNAVKVVTDKDGYALYFSRATIPWDRDARRQWYGRESPLLPVILASTLTVRSFINTCINWEQVPLASVLSA